MQLPNSKSSLPKSSEEIDNPSNFNVQRPNLHTNQGTSLPVSPSLFSTVELTSQSKMEENNRNFEGDATHFSSFQENTTLNINMNVSGSSTSGMPADVNAIHNLFTLFPGYQLYGNDHAVNYPISQAEPARQMIDTKPSFDISQAFEVAPPGSGSGSGSGSHSGPASEYYGLGVGVGVGVKIEPAEFQCHDNTNSNANYNANADANVNANANNSFFSGSAEFPPQYETGPSRTTNKTIPTPPCSKQTALLQRNPSSNPRSKSWSGRATKERSGANSNSSVLPLDNLPYFKYVKQAQLSQQPDVVKQQIENKFQWLPLSEMTEARKDAIGTMKEFALLNEKDLEGLNSYIWLKQHIKRTDEQLKTFPRCIISDSVSCTENPSFVVQVRTSSGYNDFTKELLNSDDINLLKLRHMVLLRESDDRRRKNRYYQFTENKLKRPLNNFMIYRSAVIKSLSILRVINLATKLVKETNSVFQNWNEKQCIAAIKMVIQLRGNSDLRDRIKLPEQTVNYISQIIDKTLYEYPMANSTGQYAVANTHQPKEPIYSNNTVLSHVVTEMWKTEGEEIKKRFAAFSKVEKAHHNSVFPKYKFIPVKKVCLDDNFE
ncbi:hypothetical protein C6P41_002570 [Kluyveromyces marxianus]|nr:hypothetical protein C6P43_004765 [Kluyveromyces marxianus]KAG0684032.1 hypothetical protein C6P41_002570 [Kluyveromyces marxianus]